jgi:hypothetical protein
MKRHWVFALAALVAVPRLAPAQGDSGWGPEFRITPYIGISPGIKQSGVATTLNSNGTISQGRYTLDYSSAMPLGVNAEYRFWERWGVIAGGAWASRSNGTLTDLEALTRARADGATFWMAKAALALKLREYNRDMQLRRLNATVFIGPALIHDEPKASALTPASARGSVNQLGLNFGADAELPLANPKLAFQAGLEDWMVTWDEEGYGARIMPYFPSSTAIAIETKRTHMWVLRFGLSFRF